MYIPKIYRSEDEELMKKIISQNAFALLISDKEKLAQLATIPSREGLLTMLAGGMIAIAKDLSICLDLYAKQKEEN